jgi:NAD(P)-dependent dehydrogenase (short-subunit alcohol dehydrogenase family)
LHFFDTSMMKTNPVMFITGGSRGIGAATALAAAKAGYDLALTFRSNAQAARDVAWQIEALGRKALLIEADVAKEADTLRAFAEIFETFGSFDCLVNNAGVVDAAARVDEMSVERLTRMFEINVIGTFVCCREAIKHMSTAKGGKGGSIVNLSSAAARIGSPGQYVDYAASKGAIDTLTLGLSKEVAAEGIRVNAVRPGLIYTDIHASGGLPDRVDQLKGGVPMRRGGTADEIAQAIVWLASDAASYCTGAILDVTGGR